MSNAVIKPGELATALSEQLSLYREETIEALNAAGERAVKKLVALTKQSAPVRKGKYKKAITYTEERMPTGDKKFTWGAKSPEHRKTHLLVNGYATADGNRVAGNPFLVNALETVLPEYETDAEEAIRNAE